MRIYDVDGQLSLFGPDGCSGKTCREPSPAEIPRGRTSGSSWRKPREWWTQPAMCLDLRRDSGLVLGIFWQTVFPSHGGQSTHNFSECPKDAEESRLSRILQGFAPRRYYLSTTACRGIIRRAKARGKPLPEALLRALEIQGNMASSGVPMELPQAFACNQRDEMRDLHDVSAALTAQPGMKAQTFVAAGFSAGAGASAGSTGYTEELSPTLKGTESGNCMPSVLCLNDNGRRMMDCQWEKTGTLRAQEHGHQPLVLFENHGIDGRYTGPHPVSPTLPTRMGTGGNNTPLVGAYGIAATAVGRQPQNGGNGIGVSEEMGYTLTATDEHCVCQFGGQQGDCPDTGIAGQKSPSDPVRNPAAEGLYIRRLMPIECERLQGFPDGWTEIPGASDSARYRALGNSIAVPCFVYIFQNLAWCRERKLRLLPG